MSNFNTMEEYRSTILPPLTEKLGEVSTIEGVASKHDKRFDNFSLSNIDQSQLTNGNVATNVRTQGNVVNPSMSSINQQPISMAVPHTNVAPVTPINIAPQAPQGPNHLHPMQFQNIKVAQKTNSPEQVLMNSDKSSSVSPLPDKTKQNQFGFNMPIVQPDLSGMNSAHGNLMQQPVFDSYVPQRNNLPMVPEPPLNPGQNRSRTASNSLPQNVDVQNFNTGPQPQQVVSTRTSTMPVQAFDVNAMMQTNDVRGSTMGFQTNVGAQQITNPWGQPQVAGNQTQNAAFNFAQLPAAHPQPPVSTQQPTVQVHQPQTQTGGAQMGGFDNFQSSFNNSAAHQKHSQAPSPPQQQQPIVQTHNVGHHLSHPPQAAGGDPFAGFMNFSAAPQETQPKQSFTSNNDFFGPPPGGDNASDGFDFNFAAPKQNTQNKKLAKVLNTGDFFSNTAQPTNQNQSNLGFDFAQGFPHQPQATKPAPAANNSAQSQHFNMDFNITPQQHTGGGFGFQPSPLATITHPVPQPQQMHQTTSAQKPAQSSGDKYSVFDDLLTSNQGDSLITADNQQQRQPAVNINQFPPTHQAVSEFNFGMGGQTQPPADPFAFASTPQNQMAFGMAPQPTPPVNTQSNLFVIVVSAAKQAEISKKFEELDLL